MTAEPEYDGARTGERPLVYRQTLATRITHWIWAASLFFLLLSGLQIFNAHPSLYLGDQSGFGFDNAVLEIGAANTADGAIGYVEVGEARVETTGMLGLFGAPDSYQVRAFPDWATIPSGRVVHFFFAWILVGTLLVWLVASLFNGHLRRDLVPRGRDFRNLPGDIARHIKLRFHRAREYNTLQKFSYFGVLFVLLPLMILTELAMSPAMNAAMPWLPEILGGRQTARTIHFVVMVLLVLFFLIHILMVVAAGPFNEIRSIITGWYRTDTPTEPAGEDK